MFINKADYFCWTCINSQLGYRLIYLDLAAEWRSFKGLLFRMCVCVCVRWQKQYFEQNGSICSLQELSARLLVCLCLCLCGWMNHWPCVSVWVCVCVRVWHNRLTILWPTAYSEKTKTNQLLCTIDLGSSRQTPSCFFMLMLLWLMDWLLSFVFFFPRNQLALDKTRRNSLQSAWSAHTDY